MEEPETYLSESLKMNLEVYFYLRSLGLALEEIKLLTEVCLYSEEPSFRLAKDPKGGWRLEDGSATGITPDHLVTS